MSVYKTISNQSVFDVGIKTTGDFSILFDIISQFRNINDYVPIGESVEYTLPRVVKKLIIPVPITNDRASTYLTGGLQTVYDVAVQLYGDISRVDEILKYVRNLGTKIDFAFPIPYTPNSDPVSLFFIGKRVSTATEDTAIIGDFRLLESGDYRLLETSDYRLLE